MIPGVGFFRKYFPVTLRDMRGNKMSYLSMIEFNVQSYLRTAGAGRKLVSTKPGAVFFSQGSLGEFVFYLHSGRAKITAVSDKGKEATLTLLSPGDFFGQDSIASEGSVRTATASGITQCSALRIESSEILRVMREESTFSALFMSCLLTRNMRIQADLVDHLFNSGEKRLARILLLMADFGKDGKQSTLLPPITQEALADMIGTTRSRVSFFMNRFRKMGFIEYNGRILVHQSLRRAIVQDRTAEQDASVVPFLRAG
jgi:CRP/FNR family transcriptional regulator, cyclic AMP receptor protein